MKRLLLLSAVILPALAALAKKRPAFDAPVQKVADALQTPTAPRGFRNPSPVSVSTLEQRLSELEIKPRVDLQRLVQSINRIDPRAAVPLERLPADVLASVAALKPGARRFHGAKVPLSWFPFRWISSPCADKFCYLTPLSVRVASRLPINPVTRAQLIELGDLMADPGRETAGDSTIPAGYTYFGQFVDHDTTLDVSSSLDVNTWTDASTLNNMRSPVLDLDSVYGQGPAVDPFLYVFPSSGPPTAIKLALGENQPTGPGGPGGSAGAGGLVQQVDYDLPRMNNCIRPGSSTQTALVGDPRNDENLIVSQFHHTMLKFHNQVVDLLLLAAFPGDIFLEAKKIVTQHYQWAVLHDFLRRICGPAAVNHALNTAKIPIGRRFCMPVEFAVAAYRFGHSMIRDVYWLSFRHPAATLHEVFTFNRRPDLPVFSDRAVDFNAFFDTGIPVPVNNKARPIDSNLAHELESLPDFTGPMAILARRNLLRGLVLGLPSGQATATFLGIAPMTTAQLTQGLPAAEVAVLNHNGGLLLHRTPLWYYVLREAAVLGSGNRLGPVGARIVAETFVRMLSRDAGSVLNVPVFTPFLPSASAGDFTVADLVNFAGVTQP